MRKHLIILSLLLACAGVPAFAGVNISSPGNGSQVSSPFVLLANAATCSSQSIAAMGYSFDNSPDAAIVHNNWIQANVPSSSGTHTLHVKAWGNKGSVCVTDVTITVTTGSSGPPSVPPSATSVGAIQTLDQWKAVNDGNTGGGYSSGSTNLTGSPSMTGQARQFSSQLATYGGVRYYVTFGDDESATNFLYDGYVYLGSSANSIANIEMDLNQVMPNGQTVIFGFQCDGWSGTWDYTGNAGNAWAPVDRWYRSTASCNPQNWTTNAWHHVQVQYSRDDSGNVTYKSVWLDGNQQTINGTVFSAFALGWGPTLLTNFQVDGVQAGGSPVVYLDNLTVYRW
ncbi:MAG: hypothetical protein JOZ83_04020 [Silvibacterium sp.]|nr:hypothetical protein [Silvibacterium sp.]